MDAPVDVEVEGAGEDMGAREGRGGEPLVALLAGAQLGVAEDFGRVEAPAPLEAEVPAGPEHVGEARVGEHVKGVQGRRAEAVGEGHGQVFGLLEGDDLVDFTGPVFVPVAAQRVGRDADRAGDAHGFDGRGGLVDEVLAVGVALFEGELPPQDPGPGLEVAAEQGVAEVAAPALVDVDHRIDGHGRVAGALAADTVAGLGDRPGRVDDDLLTVARGVAPSQLGIRDREAAVAVAADDGRA